MGTSKCLRCNPQKTKNKKKKKKKENMENPKDLNIRHDTLKLLEENISKTFPDRSHTNVLLGQFPKAIEIKVKINK